ncbi:MAG: 30S ribosome-binding factor RbfA [Bdellovibrionales bacterium]|nr:30S ribosome-binding factor RbfA [Bdellovibrionales bacterium]
MQETRKQRLASVIQQELSVAVRSIKDPRVPSVTFTQVEVTDDGSQATVYVTILGGDGSLGDHADRAAIRDCLEGLKSAAGYLRRHLAKILTIRHIPSLIFKEDRGLANVSRVHELLKQVNAGPSSATPADSSDDEET